MALAKIGRVVRDTVQRLANGEWDFHAIFNREVYPALNRLALRVDGTVDVEVFDLIGASHTLLFEHIRNYVRVSHSSSCTLEIPPDSDGPFEEGHWFRGIQSGAGALTIVAGTGVTINFPETLVMYKQWGTFALVHTASDNTWDFDGDVELA